MCAMGLKSIGADVCLSSKMRGFDSLQTRHFLVAIPIWRLYNRQESKELLDSRGIGRPTRLLPERRDAIAGSTPAYPAR